MQVYLTNAEMVTLYLQSEKNSQIYNNNGDYIVLERIYPQHYRLIVALLDDFMLGSI